MTQTCFQSKVHHAYLHIVTSLTPPFFGNVIGVFFYKHQIPSSRNTLQRYMLALRNGTTAAEALIDKGFYTLYFVNCVENSVSFKVFPLSPSPLPLPLFSVLTPFTDAPRRIQYGFQAGNMLLNLRVMQHKCDVWSSHSPLLSDGALLVTCNSFSSVHFPT